jgi:hypothetical protein
VAGTYSPAGKLTGANLSQGLASYETSMSQYAMDLGLGWRF